jgi:hypothetical protein
MVARVSEDVEMAPKCTGKEDCEFCTKADSAYAAALAAASADAATQAESSSLTRISVCSVANDVTRPSAQGMEVCFDGMPFNERPSHNQETDHAPHDSPRPALCLFDDLFDAPNIARRRLTGGAAHSRIDPTRRSQRQSASIKSSNKIERSKYIPLQRHLYTIQEIKRRKIASCKIALQIRKEKRQQVLNKAANARASKMNKKYVQ